MTMNKFFQHIIIVATSLLATLSASAQYFNAAEVPDCRKFLPGPPSFLESRFSVDTKQYFYGKEIQKNNPERAEQIRFDSSWGVPAVANIFSPVLGQEIIATKTPRLWALLLNGFTSSGYGANYKDAIGRIRPCVRYNETPYSAETLTEMKRSKSYPSAHTCVSWGDGMLLAAVAPHAQERMLRRAYEVGQSRVYGGMHWQSDVTDARYISSACVARMMCSPTFKTHLESTRQEINKLLLDSLGISEPDYNAENYYDINHLPNPIEYLDMPMPLDSASVELAHDMSQYLWGKSIRNTDRGIKAKFDISSDFDVLANEFSQALGSEISPYRNTATYNLLKAVVESSDLGCKKAQQEYQRQRPYSYFKDEVFTFENVDHLTQEGSYPSVNAARAWTAALIMVSIAPERQDTLLKVGYELGQSAVITGINWQSDVDAGRIVACATLSRYLSNPNFMTLLEAAQEEHANNSRQIVTDQEDITIDKSPEQDLPFYTIDGRRASSESKGILVSKNKKILR